MNLNGAFKTAKVFLSKNSSSIATGLGIVSMVTGTVLAVKATPKALELIEEAEEIKELDAEAYDIPDEPLTPVEVVKAAWKPYVIPVLFEVAGISLVLFGSHISYKKTAALTTAYELSTKALREYKEAVKEIAGDEVAKKVRGQVAKKNIEQTERPIAISPDRDVEVTGTGNTLCFDTMTGRYFRGNINEIEAAVNKLNGYLVHGTDDFIQLNRIYQEIGLDEVDIGWCLGWNVDALIDISFSTIIDRKHDDAVVVLNYEQSPIAY